MVTTTNYREANVIFEFYIQKCHPLSYKLLKYIASSRKWDIVPLHCLIMLAMRFSLHLSIVIHLNCR